MNGLWFVDGCGGTAAWTGGGGGGGGVTKDRAGGGCDWRNGGAD